MANIDSGSITAWTGTLDSTSPFGHTISVPMAAGSDRVIVLALTSGLGGTEPTFTVTADGVAMTMLDKTATGGPNSQERLYYLAMGTGGSATVSVFCGVGSWYGQKVALTGFVLTGIDQTTPWGTPAKNGSSFQNSPISTSVTATSNDLTVVVTGANAASGISFGTSQTNLGALTGLDTVVPAHSYKLGASTSVSTAWTSGQTQASQLAAVAIGVSVSALSGGPTLDDGAAAGTLTSTASDMSGGGVLDGVTAAGSMGMNPGTCVIPALKNWGGSLQTSVTVPWVTFCRLSDAVQVLVLANQVSNGTTAALVPGTSYMALGFNVDGSQRFACLVVAT